jgi:hypothetical protein
MDAYKSLEQVNDRDSFVIFLNCLSKDFDENHDEWENWTIAEYLESISAWIKDNDEDLDNIDFKKMAEVFYVGKIYE